MTDANPDFQSNPVPAQPEPQSDNEGDVDAVLKPRKKPQLSEERRKQMADRMRVIAAERVKKLKEAKNVPPIDAAIPTEVSVVEPVVAELPKPKRRVVKKPREPVPEHESKPVVYPESNEIEDVDPDPLPNPISVISKQKERLLTAVEELKQAKEIQRKLEADRKKEERDAVSKAARLERAAKKKADKEAMALVAAENRKSVPPPVVPASIPKPPRVITKNRHVYDNAGVNPVLLGKFV